MLAEGGAAIAGSIRTPSKRSPTLDEGPVRFSSRCRRRRSVTTRSCSFTSALAPCYIAVRGYAAPASRTHPGTCPRAAANGPNRRRNCSEPCWERGSGAWCAATSGSAWTWPGEGMRLADRLADPGILMEALFMPGVTMFYRAEFAAARRYFERALATYDDRERTKFWSTFTGHNAGVTHRCYLALALWHLGYADQAMKRGSRDAPARPHHRPRVQHRSRPGFHGVSLPVLSTRQRSAGGRRGRDRDRHGPGFSALARARDASQGRGIAPAWPP